MATKQKSNDLSETRAERQSDVLATVIEEIVKRVIAEELGDVWQKFDAIDSELIDLDDKVNTTEDYATEDYVDNLYDELTERLDNASLDI